MAVLPQHRIDEINSEVFNSIDYNPDIRTILLSTVNRDFRKLLITNTANSQTQITLDLIALNDAEKLSDGTVPLEAWLERASRLVKPFPGANAVVQKALSDISAKNLHAAPIKNATPPTRVVIDKIQKERIVISNDMVTYRFLEAGTKAGISVGLMMIQRFDNGIAAVLPDLSPVLYLGTGWLISNDLIITNHHVINAREDHEPDAIPADFQLQGNNAIIKFDYNAENAAGTRAEIVKLEAFNDELDYAILRLKVLQNRTPLSLLPEQINLINNKPQVVNIIQHPLGLSKKVALRNNHIYETEYPQITYFTDTDGGTSGSPVFNDQWSVIALHRASITVGNVAYQGQTTAWVNEGVQIKAIIDHLSTNHGALANEILNPQP